jgi:hypothetical protein
MSTEEFDMTWPPNSDKTLPLTKFTHVTLIDMDGNHHTGRIWSYIHQNQVYDISLDSGGRGLSLSAYVRRCMRKMILG